MNKKTLIIFGIFTFICFHVGWSQVINLTYDNYKDVAIKSDKLVVVEFRNTGIITTMRKAKVAYVIEKNEQEFRGRAVFTKIDNADVMEGKGSAEMDKFIFDTCEIDAIDVPSVVFLKNGKLLGRLQGVDAIQSSFVSELNKHL